MQRSVFTRQFIYKTLSVLLLVSGATMAVNADEVLRLTFDRGIVPETARGIGKAKQTQVEFAEGINGTQGLLLKADTLLEYPLITEGPESINTHFQNNAGTVEFWARPVDWAPAEAKKSFRFIKIGLKGADEEFSIFIPSDGATLWFVAGDMKKAEGDRPFVTGDISDWKKNEWHMLSAVWDGRKMCLYIDGQLKTESLIAKHIHGRDFGFRVNFAGSLRLGGQQSPCFPGAVTDEISIFNEALSADAIRKRFDFRKQSAASQRQMVLPVPQAKNVPKIDGKISAGEWSEATFFSGFSSGGAFLPGNKLLCPLENSVYLLHDRDFLYLGLVSENPPGKELRALSKEDDTETDACVFRDDDYEVCIFRDPAEKTFYMFQVNSLGFGGDFVGFIPKWKCNWQKAASNDGKYFYAEMKIPLAELAKGYVYSPGDRWYLFIDRCYKTYGEKAYSAVLTYAERYGQFDEYAELMLLPAGHNVSCRLDVKTMPFGKVAVDGKISSAVREASGNAPAVIICESPANQKSVELKLGPNGEYLEQFSLPEGIYRLKLEGGNFFSVRKYFTVQSFLKMDKKIFSYREELEVTADLSGLMASLADKHLDQLVFKIKIMDTTANKTEIEQTYPVQKNVGIYTVPLRQVSEGKKNLIGEVLAKETGRQLAVSTIPFRRFTHMEGEGNTLGITDKVPWPWTPMEVKEGNSVCVWGREYRYGNSGLPGEIIVQGDNILKEPLYYEVEWVDGKKEKITGGTARVTTRKETETKLTHTYKSKNLQLKQHITVEFDGMVKNELEMKSDKPVKGFRLVIPVKKEYSKYFDALIGSAHPKRVTWRVMVPYIVDDAFSWKSATFYYGLTTMCMNRGITWFAPSPKTWKVDLDKPYEEFITEKDCNKIVIHLINTEKTDVTGVTAEHGIQAFPTRPPHPKRWEHQLWKLYLVFEPTFKEYELFDRWKAQKQGVESKSPVDLWEFRELCILPEGNFPRGLEDMENPGLYADLIKMRDERVLGNMAKNGETLFLYACPTYGSTRLPEWDYYGEEWKSVPAGGFPFFCQPRITSSNRKWRDFYLFNFDRFLRRYPAKACSIDCSELRGDMSKANGMGYTREDGVTYEEYPIWETRELNKRCYIIQHAIYPDGFRTAGSDKPFMPLDSFYDYRELEAYLGVVKKSYHEKSWVGLPLLDEMKLMYKINYGPESIVAPPFNNYEDADMKASSVHHYGLMLLLNIPDAQYRLMESVKRAIRTLRKSFGWGTADITFYPYYDIADQVKTSEEFLKVSVYTAKNKALIVLTNDSTEKDFNGTVAIDLAKFGLVKKPLDCKIYSPMTQACKKAPDGAFYLETDPIEYRDNVFHVQGIEKELFKVILVSQPE